MKIVMITGSAHRQGTTATLADQFQKGAVEAGHDVFRFDAAFQSVHPCIGCDKCYENGTCVFQADDMKLLNPHLLEADVVVFVSPIYYFSINAQIKAVIDRFYANNGKLQGGKKAILITAMADTGMNSAVSANMMFEEMTRYLQWENAGILNVLNAMTVSDLKKEDLEKAYQLGNKLQ